jgi:hypothetical protein
MPQGNITTLFGIDLAVCPKPLTFKEKDETFESDLPGMLIRSRMWPPRRAR